MKVVRLIYCLMSIVGLVATFTIRLIDDSDNNIASIKLELSAVLFLIRRLFIAIAIAKLIVHQTCKILMPAFCL